MHPNSINVHVFVSCPGDVASEKAIVKQVCNMVNSSLIHNHCDVHLVFRDFSEIIGQTGHRPQQLINDYITGYHVYLGILYKRFGTPTGAINPLTGQEFESGTEEEYVIASEKNKIGGGPQQIFFFFKDQDGSKTVAENEQAGKVLAFKESLMPNDWVNSFDTPSNFERRITQQLTTIGYGLCLESKTAVKKQVIEDMTSPASAIGPKVDISGFVPELPDLPYYIPRSITQLQPSIDHFNEIIFGEETKKVFLRDALLNERKIVLLGNAGSGKSVELQQAAKYYLNAETPFIPIYKRFNTFNGQKIDDFLPEGWDQINSEIALILLDGLDEIQPQYFNTAVKEILDFTERNPELRMIVSSRTNFYELPTATFSGTLTNFHTFILNDISLAEIKSYTTANFDIDGQEFIYQAHKQSFLDLIQKPFFLDILLRHYKLKGNFNTGRAQIIEESILSRIDFDNIHFKGTLDLPVSKKKVLALLEKVAFVMEVMGKNFISDEELSIALKDEQEVEQIKYFSAFTRNTENNLWMFEHNNIQEFLAARVLGKQSFDKLIDKISFPPSHNKVKPTWVNTLSFFISIGNTVLVQKLVEWMVDKEMEILVKFEPDRIEESLRIDLFKQIFNFYKERGIWLNSNKFTDDELARFGSSTDAIDFLIQELGDTSNSRIVKRNAVSIIDSFDYNDFEAIYRQKVIDALIRLLDENTDPGMAHSIMYGLAKIGISDKKTTDGIISKYAKRKNQYIRAGLYKLINNSEYSEDYVDILLDGIALGDMEEAEEDRESVNLMDESWQLKEGLMGIKTPIGLKKVLSYFKRSPDERRIEFHDKEEVFTKILQNAITANSGDNSMYQELYDVYISSARSYDRDYAMMIVLFFEETGTKWQTFKSLWKDEKVKERYQKDFLLEQLIDKSVTDNFLIDYTSREYSNQDAEKFYQLMTWQLAPGSELFYLIAEFKEKLLKLSGLKLEMPARVDWNEINCKKAQDSFDILFNKEGLLKEVGAVFSEIGKEELTFDELWELRKDNMRELEDYFIGAVVELLRSFVREGKTVRYEEIKAWTEEEPNFTDYIIQQVYGYLHGNQANLIVVKPEQLAFITSWSREAESKYNIIEAIDSDEDSGSINGQVVWLWFFVKYFKIRLTESKLLDFTMFSEFQSTKTESIPQQLEEFAAKEKIAQRVIANLNANIDDNRVWSNNAVYAVENNLKDAYPFILRDLLDHHKRKHFRGDVLEVYFKQTMDVKGLQDLLTSSSLGDIRWNIVKLLAPFDTQTEFLLERLKKILHSTTELHEEKMRAAKYLMELGDLDGLKFIANFILAAEKPTMDFGFGLRAMPNINTEEAIPILMKLLKIAKQPPYSDDRFNNLESNVTDSLYQVGIQSEESFKAVKEAYEIFTQENEDTIPHLNFLHFNLRRIEEQLYLKKSQQFSIQDAVREFEDLSK